MVVIDELKALDKIQRAAFMAAFLGWALDAFDFFLLTFILKDIAGEFHESIKAVTVAVTLTFSQPNLAFAGTLHLMRVLLQERYLEHFVTPNLT